MRVPSDDALELLDFLIEANARSASDAATSDQLMRATDIRDFNRLDELLRELVGQGYVRKQLPKLVTGLASYYADEIQFAKLIKWLDNAVPPQAEKREIKWDDIRLDIGKLKEIANNAELSQTRKAQAGAIVSSLSILVEAPDPPLKVIRSLLYDLAAIATIFALALQIADNLR